MRWNTPKSAGRKPDLYTLKKLERKTCFRYSPDLDVPGAVRIIDENGVARHAIKTSDSYHLLKDGAIYGIDESGYICEVYSPLSWVRE